MHNNIYFSVTCHFYQSISRPAHTWDFGWHCGAKISILASHCGAHCGTSSHSLGTNRAFQLHLSESRWRETVCGEGRLFTAQLERMSAVLFGWALQEVCPAALQTWARVMSVIERGKMDFKESNYSKGNYRHNRTMWCSLSKWVSSGRSDIHRLPEQVGSNAEDKPPNGENKSIHLKLIITF